MSMPHLALALCSGETNIKSVNSCLLTYCMLVDFLLYVCIVCLRPIYEFPDNKLVKGQNPLLGKLTLIARRGKNENGCVPFSLFFFTLNALNTVDTSVISGPEVIKFFSCSTQWSMKF